MISAYVCGVCLQVSRKLNLTGGLYSTLPTAVLVLPAVHSGGHTVLVGAAGVKGGGRTTGGAHGPLHTSGAFGH